MAAAALGSSMRQRQLAHLAPTQGVPAVKTPDQLPAHQPRAEITYKPQGPTLEAYILDKTQRVFIMGPLGSGKTNASCWKGFRLSINQAPGPDGVRRTRGVCVRNTYPDLFSTTIKDWLDMFGHPSLGRFVQGGKEPPTHYMRFSLPDGTQVEAEIVFLALDREDHVKKLRGLQATWSWINETKEIPKAIVDMLDLRVGRYPKDVRPTWYGLFGDTNAPDNDHWYYRLAEEIRPEGWKFYKQPGGLVRASVNHPWLLNPRAENVHNLPANYYVNGAQGKKDSWVAVNLGNLYGYVGDGLPIWADYVDDVHCQTFELVPGLPLYLGLDFGLTPAAVIGQKLPNGQMRWRYEVVTTDTGVGRFANILKRFMVDKGLLAFPIAAITGDPAGDQRQPGDNEERTVFQLLAANGIVAQPAHTNDFTIRTEAVAKPMRTMIDGAPGIVIHPDMVVTRKGMAGAYKFRRLKVAGDERYEDKPVKNAWSHPCEALQYGQMGSGAGVDVIQPNTAARADDAKAFREHRALSRLHPTHSKARSGDAEAFKRKRGLR
jgi:hypothetical protein